MTRVHPASKNAPMTTYIEPALLAIGAVVWIFGVLAPLMSSVLA